MHARRLDELAQLYRNVILVILLGSTVIKIWLKRTEITCDRRVKVPWKEGPGVRPSPVLLETALNDLYFVEITSEIVS